MSKIHNIIKPSGHTGLDGSEIKVKASFQRR